MRTGHLDWSNLSYVVDVMISEHLAAVALWRAPGFEPCDSRSAAATPEGEQIRCLLRPGHRGHHTGGSLRPEPGAATMWGIDRDEVLWGDDA